MADPEIPHDGPGTRAAGPDRSAEPGSADRAEAGLRWSFDADLQAALAAIGATLEGGDEADQEEILAQLEAMDQEAADAAERDGSDLADEQVRAGTDLSGLIAENL